MSPLRIFPWTQLKQQPLGRIAGLIASALGAGLLPKAPGTWGSLVALPLIYGTFALPLRVQLVGWLALLLLGVWAAKEVCRASGTSDHQAIVIDEVVGMGLTHGCALFLSTFTQDVPISLSPQYAITVLIAFRFFDVLKFIPVRQVDTWSKNAIPGSWKSGWGVMLDDVMASLQASVLVLLVQHFFYP